MLQVQHQQLENATRQKAMEILQKEISLYSGNFAVISTQSALLAGFELNLMASSNPFISPTGDEAHEIWGLVFFFFASLTIATSLMAVATSTLSSMLAPKLALLGPEGAVQTAVKGMKQEHEWCYNLNLAGLVFFYMSAMVVGWCNTKQIYHLPAIVISLTLGISVVVLMFALRRISLRFEIPADDSDQMNLISKIQLQSKEKKQFSTQEPWTLRKHQRSRGNREAKSASRPSSTNAWASFPFGDWSGTNASDVANSRQKLATPSANQAHFEDSTQCTLSPVSVSRGRVELESGTKNSNWFSWSASEAPVGNSLPVMQGSTLAMNVTPARKESGVDEPNGTGGAGAGSRASGSTLRGRVELDELESGTKSSNWFSWSNSEAAAGNRLPVMQGSTLAMNVTPAKPALNAAPKLACSGAGAVDGGSAKGGGRGSTSTSGSNTSGSGSNTSASASTNTNIDETPVVQDSSKNDSKNGSKNDSNIIEDFGFTAFKLGQGMMSGKTKRYFSCSAEARVVTYWETKGACRSNLTGKRKGAMQVVNVEVVGVYTVPVTQQQHGEEVGEGRLEGWQAARVADVNITCSSGRVYQLKDVGEQACKQLVGAFGTSGSHDGADPLESAARAGMVVAGSGQTSGVQLLAGVVSTGGTKGADGADGAGAGSPKKGTRKKSSASVAVEGGRNLSMTRAAASAQKKLKAGLLSEKEYEQVLYWLRTGYCPLSPIALRHLPPCRGTEATYVMTQRFTTAFFNLRILLSFISPSLSPPCPLPVPSMSPLLIPAGNGWARCDAIASSRTRDRSSAVTDWSTNRRRIRHCCPQDRAASARGSESGCGEHGK
jgi:hypothetical protein